MTELRKHQKERSWFEPVPERWRVGRLKSTVASARNGVWGEEPNGYNDIWCVRVADFNRPHQAVGSENKTYRRVEELELRGRILSRGDLLLEKSGGGDKNPVGFVVRYDHDEPAVCSNFVARIQTCPGMDSRYWSFVHLTLYALRLTERSVKQSTGIQNLDQASYFNEVVPIPPEDEQTAIADYLDRETAQIDAFIAKNEELISLALERMQAQIDLAFQPDLLNTSISLRRLGVTRESGVSVNGAAEPAAQGAIGVLKTSAVSSAVFRPQANKAVIASDTHRVRCHVKAHHLLVNRANTPDLVGSAAIAPDDHPNLFLSDKLWQVSFKEASAEYIYWWTRSSFYREQIREICVGSSSSMQNLSFSSFMALQINPADLDSRESLVRTLAAEQARINGTIATAKRAIELAKEKRAALISAAVTGKIDVRSAA